MGWECLGLDLGPLLKADGYVPGLLTMPLFIGTVHFESEAAT
jgi:hypothetical protein